MREQGEPRHCDFSEFETRFSVRIFFHSINYLDRTCQSFFKIYHLFQLEKSENHKVNFWRESSIANDLLILLDR